MIPGEHVRLRPVEREDLPRFVQWFADPEFRSHIAMYQPMSLLQEERWYEQNSVASDTQPWAIDALVDAAAEARSRAAWEHIGCCGFHNIDWRNRVGEIGIIIGPRNYWGRGFGTDATRTLVAWGFDTLNLNRIFLKVYSDNLRAIRCYEKIGFQLEGRMRQDNYCGGVYRDTLIMGILREEWYQAKPPE